MIRQIQNGIRRHPWRFVLSIPVAFAAIWAVVDAFVSVHPSLGNDKLLILIGMVALLIGFVQAWSPDKISLYWNDLRLKVEIKTGDLFSQDGNFAISCDDFFLTHAPKLVNQKSLMGQLVSREYSGQPDLVDNDLIKFMPSLNNVAHESTGIPGKDKRYPIGTTVAIRSPQKRIFVTALCKIDLASNSGRASTSDVWVALHGLWQAIADNPTGKHTSVPLFGTGQTSAGLSYSVSLNLMLASLIVAARQRPISDEIHILIPPNALEYIDLRIIQETWSNPKK